MCKGQFFITYWWDPKNQLKTSFEVFSSNIHIKYWSRAKKTEHLSFYPLLLTKISTYKILIVQDFQCFLGIFGPFPVILGNKNISIWHETLFFCWANILFWYINTKMVPRCFREIIIILLTGCHKSASSILECALYWKRPE